MRAGALPLRQEGRRTKTADIIDANRRTRQVFFRELNRALMAIKGDIVMVQEGLLAPAVICPPNAVITMKHGLADVLVHIARTFTQRTM